MMIAEQIKNLFAYNEWAWNQVYTSLGNMDTAAYFAQRPIFEETSLHALLVHCLFAEYIWLARCLGHSPKTVLAADEYADLTAVREHWAAVRDDWSSFLRGLTDEDMARLVAYHNTSGRAFSLVLADLLQHVINHATEHRSQMTPILFRLGVPTPPLDYMRFRLRPS